MKNTLGDLNNHLFAAIERLNDEDLAGDKLIEEINRSKAITGIAAQIISGGQLVLKAQMMYDEALDASKKLPPMLEAGS